MWCGLCFLFSWKRLKFLKKKIKIYIKFWPYWAVKIHISRFFFKKIFMKFSRFEPFSFFVSNPKFLFKCFDFRINFHGSPFSRPFFINFIFCWRFWHRSIFSKFKSIIKLTSVWFWRLIDVTIRFSLNIDLIKWGKQKMLWKNLPKLSSKTNMKVSINQKSNYFFIIYLLILGFLHFPLTLYTIRAWASGKSASSCIWHFSGK